MTSTDQDAIREFPGLLEVLALVPDPRKRRGRRFGLSFVLAVAVACALAGAKNFREAGDHAAELPQDVLARLGGQPHPLLGKIIAPSETRIRTLIHAVGADLLDDLTGGWLRDLADAGRLDGLLTAIAIDGKWLRGVADGQVKLFAAMLQGEKVIIARHRIPDETTEITQVRQLLEPADLRNAVVTADAAHAQRDTAGHVAGKEEDGGRESDYFLFVKGSQPKLQKAIFDAIQAAAPGSPITPSWTGATAEPSAAPSGSPAPTASTSRTSATSPGSAATATTPTGSSSARKSSTPSPASTPHRPAPPASRRSPAASGASNRSTGCATPHMRRIRTPDTPETARRSWPRCGISPSACSTSTASKR